ncbi:hypothetical protein NKR19_g8550 [Coniochaeta hoffmannii]|uniref:Uncharacterized protein n=1 Tax=Coniochaeta hoffmannii TaxID=91930 RepID=A0AA38RE22_9PEZI|nr:hypothetical protein NKR19_g8550 [Coniochaeta hoffmannii]
MRRTSSFAAAGRAKPGDVIFQKSAPRSTVSGAPPPDEPYYQPALSGNGAGAADSGSGSWPPISQEALVEPKVSSIIVDVDELDRWEQHWLDAHEGHYHPDYPLKGLGLKNLDPA